MRLPPSPASRPLALEVLAEIAVGATARVDLCRVTDGGGRLVAVKRLHPELAEDPSFVRRFLDEVWMTAALKHQNVVEVAGWGTDDAGLYLAVELVQGVSLARLLKTVKGTGEAFTERMVVYVAARVCRGLAAAHSLRAPDGRSLALVHRDLTLSNVLVGFNGDVKIADFGLAKAKERLGQTTLGLGSRPSRQLVPEEMMGAEIDHRADLFSLGVLLFELLAGRHPWASASEIETLELIATAPTPDLFELRPKVNKDIVGLVTRCLEKDPKTRPASAEALLTLLEEWLGARGYGEDNAEALARFVRRNAMRQMGWFERVIAGEPPKGAAEPIREPPAAPQDDGAALRTISRTDATTVGGRPAPDSTGVSSEERTTPRRTGRKGAGNSAEWEVATLVQRRDDDVEELSLADAHEILDPESEDNAPTIAMRLATAGVMRGAMLRTAQRPAPSPPPKPAPDPRIRSEADRLAQVAARWAEEATRAGAEARSAAAQAMRLAEAARLAGEASRTATEAAAMAAEALRLATSSGPDDAARHLSRALELERSIEAARKGEGA